MAAITAAMVKDLRERTGAGMMDCKNVLGEADGDIEKAIELLREKGLAKAAKKSGRVAAQGLVQIKITDDGKKAALAEVNSETDFVAKNEEFIEFVNNIAALALNTGVTDIDAFLGEKYSDEGTVSEVLTAKIAKIGENLSVRRFEKLEKAGTVNVGYIHGAGKIGVIVQIETEAAVADVNECGRDIAMQVASMNPKFVDESSVDQEYLENEKKILMQQALNEGKPADIAEKMVVGRIKKELKEVCLIEQKFVKDSEITVAQYVENCAKKIGKAVKIISFTRFEVGEGIEVEHEDFAAEVAKQMGN